jgi:predicted nucleic acid-binding protein
LIFRPTPNTAESARCQKRPDKPIGGNDLRIATHAYTTGTTIVTVNIAEFKRIPGLNVENGLP